MLAAVGSVAILAGGMALAGSASAASLPSCANGVKCQSNAAGEAGYFGADDNHTHYRYVQTEVVATQSLVNLNGLDSTTHQGGVGVELCDPNDFGITNGDISGDLAAQLFLGHTASGFQVRFRVGFFSKNADPCIQNGFTNPNFTFSQGQPLMESGVNPGDELTLAIWYDPNPGDHHFHQISFGVCDVTTDTCRQAYSATPFQAQFFEFGIGAFTHNVQLTGGAINPSESFASNDVTCYSCAHPVPITSVSPVNATGTGGLEEAQFVNSTGQVELSPLDSLAANSNFKLWEGSTSI